MAEEKKSSLVLPKEDGRLRKLAQDVRAGRDGFNAGLNPLYYTDFSGEHETGGTGTRTVTVGESLQREPGEHAFQGELPHEVIELEPRFDHVQVITQLEPTVQELQNKDREFVAERLPQVREALASLGKSN